MSADNRLYFHAHTTPEGQRSVETLSRERATDKIKSLADSTRLVVPWKTGGWGKKLGNVAGLEWFKMGYVRPPAYTNPTAHEHFTNPDAPIFPRAAVFAGNLLGFFHGTVVVHQANGNPSFTGELPDWSGSSHIERDKRGANS
jgi:hypothetical protein